MLRDQTAGTADRQLAYLNHTMQLEKQGVTDGDLSDARARLIDDLLRTNPRRLWDTP